MILTFQPIKVWPEGWQDPKRPREQSQFSATYGSTLTVLDRELEHLRALSCTLQVDAQPNRIRGDGQLYADAKVNHPGVILTVETKKLGTLVYATDRFENRYYGSPSWHHNLRAIALGLEALRRVERYGIAERGQQYAGYRELGTGIPLGQEPAPTMTADEAARFMVTLAWPNDPEDHQADAAGFALSDPDYADLVYRTAAKKCHPDVGGNPEEFKRLGEARRIVAKAWQR